MINKIFPTVKKLSRKLKSCRERPWLWRTWLVFWRSCRHHVTCRVLQIQWNTRFFHKLQESCNVSRFLWKLHRFCKRYLFVDSRDSVYKFQSIYKCTTKPDHELVPLHYWDSVEKKKVGGKKTPSLSIQLSMTIRTSFTTRGDVWCVWEVSSRLLLGVVNESWGVWIHHPHPDTRLHVRGEGD